jgi:farnesyl-diphosphate farnesyltransferase
MLHRAFSVFLFTPDGRLVLQQVRTAPAPPRRRRRRQPPAPASLLPSPVAPPQTLTPLLPAPPRSRPPACPLPMLCPSPPQRAASKITFPLIWANTCCSHPLSIASETIEDDALGVRNAARRKLEQELGIPPDQVPLSAFTWITRVHYLGANGDTDGPSGGPMWGEHEIDWILMCAPGRRVDFALNPNEVASVREFTQAELREWMATRAERGEEVSPWFGAMEASGLLYSWWDAVLAGDLAPVMQRDVIHRQHDLAAAAAGSPAGSVPPHPAFVACLAATTAAGTRGPRRAIPASPPGRLPKVTAAAGRSGVWRASAAAPAAAAAASDAPRRAGAAGGGPAATPAAGGARPAGATTAAAAPGGKPAAAAYVPGASAAVPKQGAYGKVKIHKDSVLSQLSHLDEAFIMAGFALGLVAPVKVAPLAGVGASAEYVWCEDMLCKVSRSFAMVIQQLPLELRMSVCVFYLVLRGLDTVEDDMEAFKGRRDEKLAHLTTFYQKLTVPGWTMSGVGEGHEAELLEHFGAVNAVFAALRPVDRDTIADVCRRMGEGMAAFSGRDLTEGTTDVRDYNLYCHYVAGLVGHGLSHLFVAHGEDAEVGRDLDLANDMGLFLQKTNIIRDYLEDYVDGRAFWPKDIWSRYAPRLGDFKDLVGAPGGGGRDACLGALNHLVAEALTLAPRCLQYMERLRDPDIFKFCAIPQVMAIATLDKLANNPDVFTGVVKIRKGQALALMAGAGTMASVYAIFLKYARSIRAAIPPHHTEAHAIALRAAREVEAVCLAGLPNGAAALATSPFLSTRAVLAVLATLAALLQHLYRRSRTDGGWGDGSATYLPRITDSWDVAALVGVVACVAYLFAVGGAPLAFGRGSGASPPPSPARKAAAGDDEPAAAAAAAAAGEDAAAAAAGPRSGGARRRPAHA